MQNKLSVLLIDNEDSFTWNLVQLFEEAGALVDVRHPATMQVHEIQQYDGIIISPGGGLPDEMPGLSGLVAAGVRTKPVLGVCLGLQAIVTEKKGKLFQLDCIIHGRKLDIRIINNTTGLFEGMSNSLKAGLYHSWAAEESSLPDCFLVTATTTDGIIMAIEHKQLPVYGVQFHPESYITEKGLQIAKNFLKIISLRKE
jgi:anthranilate synthase/aminodeoxychorismate synthase-like glutamine amidotransferase